MVFAVTEEVKRYDGLAFAGEPPSVIFQAAQKEGYERWIAKVRQRYRIGRSGDAGFRGIERLYRAEVNGLPARRFKVAFNLFAAWLLPVAMLYICGTVIDWIRGGDREKAS